MFSDRHLATLGRAAAWPLAARGQQRGRKMPLIGITDDAPIWHHFRKGLRDLGLTFVLNSTRPSRCSRSRANRNGGGRLKTRITMKI
jgi:hypothetical protein